jgi:hypothetical protein
MRSEWDMIMSGSLDANNDSWESFFQYDKDGVQARAWRRRGVDGLFEYRSRIQFPVGAEQFVRAQNDVAYRLSWDDFAERLEVIKTDVQGLETLLWESRFPSPMANREYVFYRRTAETADGSFLTMGRTCPPRTAASLGLAERPQKIFGGVVRVRDYWSVQVVWPRGPSSCEAAIAYREDPRGSIPKAMVNWAVRSGFPAWIKDLLQSARRYSDWKARHDAADGGKAPGVRIVPL